MVNQKSTSKNKQKIGQRMISQQQFKKVSARGKPRRNLERNLRRQEEAEYTWQRFQKADWNSQIHLSRLTTIPPPKPIQTMQLEVPPPTPIAQKGSNLCARWLARSTLQRQLVEEVIVDESFREEEPTEDDDIVVLEETKKLEPVEPVPKKDFRQNPPIRQVDYGEESIIVIGEFPAKPKMTQLEKKMNGSFWSSPTPTSSTFSTVATSSTVIDTSIPPPPIPRPTSSSLVNLVSQNRPLMKILDGYSKDCTAAKRRARRWCKLMSMMPPSNPKSISSTFKICSYNVLCQKTIARTGYLYRHLNNQPHFLEWTHRWKGLQEELPTFDADILGLQEVQCDHFTDDFEPFMRKHGYEGIYKQKHGTEQKDDGCALFYRPEKFERVGYEEVNYFISPTAISNRENIAQILALRCRVTNEIFLIANTHLLFNEERGDVKLAQLSILFSRISRTQKKLATSSDSVPPVIVMGDFNMEANSVIYDFVVKGRLHVDGLFVRTMSGQSVRTGGKQCKASEIVLEVTAESTPRLDGSIRHPFQFTSAYHYDPAVVPKSHRNISTFHKDAAAPDFIFYTKEMNKNGVEKLQLLERFELPTFNVLTGATPWPNRHVPSDHLPIMVKFELTKDESI